MRENQPDLAQRLRRGEYVVDEYAVAEAIVRRSRTDPLLGSRLAQMFEPGHRNRLPGSVEQQRARSRPDVA